MIARRRGPTSSRVDPHADTHRWDSACTPGSAHGWTLTVEEWRGKS